MKVSDNNCWPIFMGTMAHKISNNKCRLNILSKYQLDQE